MRAMSVSRDEKHGTWTVQCWYRDWTGERRKKTRRGFATKALARRWEQDFLASCEGTPDMTMATFLVIYERDVRPKLKLNTWLTKENIIRTKILPYLGDKHLDEIEPADVLAWENELLALRTSDGAPLSQTYLHTVCNQLSALFNHAVRYYHLSSNPMSTTGKVGSKTADAMGFWTQDEYIRFSESMKCKPESFIAFELLYWCGIREGELLALTPSSFDLDGGTLSVTESYQRIHGKDVITTPKTPKSVRAIAMPEFLIAEVREHLEFAGPFEKRERILKLTKSYLYHEMERGCRSAGVKRIRVHDLRHSHVSLLIELGYPPLAIADRMGHEAIDITYRYAHLFPDKQTEMARSLDDVREGR